MNGKPAGHTVSSLFFGFLVFSLGVSLPISAQAEYGWEVAGAYQSKIGKIGSKRVKKLSVPILFGITLSMISPNFGDPRGDGTRTHEGEDVMAPEGAPIVSPTKAVVIGTGNGSGSGKYVSTMNPGGEKFVYMHLDEILVKRGEELAVGELLGYVGNTGNASGGAAHLHFEIRDGGKATDPFPRLAREFSLKNKIKYLRSAIRKVKDVDELVEFVVANYRGELNQAKAVSIILPPEIEKELTNEEKK